MALSKKWQLSAFEYHIDTFLVPILAVIALTFSSIVWWQLVLGALAWSLSEYLLHRFLFHRYFRRDHWAHHVDPKAYVGISGIYIALAATAIILPAFLLQLTSLYAGYMLAYFCYLALHYLMHRSRLRSVWYVGYLARNHDMHHRKGIEKNFGVTSPLWDFVFRTYTKSG